MPRNIALHPLSHDHHQSLILALRLKKGGPASQHDRGWPSELRAQAKATLEFAEGSILPHFAIEEEILFPACEALEGAMPLISQLRLEHNSLRDLIAELAGYATMPEEVLSRSMKQFGSDLESHIRSEERRLFPLIESRLSREEFHRLGAEILKKHESRPPDCAI